MDRIASTKLFNTYPASVEDVVVAVNERFGFELPQKPSDTLFWSSPIERKCFDCIRFLYYSARNELFASIEAFSTTCLAVEQCRTPKILQDILEALKHNHKTSKRCSEKVESYPPKPNKFSPATSFSSTSFGSSSSFSSNRIGMTTAPDSIYTSFDAFSNGETKTLPPQFVNVLHPKSDHHRHGGSRRTRKQQRLDDSSGDTDEDDAMEVAQYEPSSPRFIPITPRASSPIPVEKFEDLKNPAPPPPNAMHEETSDEPQYYQPMNIDQPRIIEHFHIRDLPSKGLFVNEITPELLHAPSIARYEFTRLQTASQSVRHDELRDLSLRNYDSFWRHVSGSDDFEKSPESSWAEDTKERLVFSATLKLRTENDSELFKISIAPAVVDRKSCRLFRKFGSKRFLRLTIPGPQKLTGYLQGFRQQYSNRLQEWLCLPNKPFMGNKWSVFLVRPSKGKRKQKKSPLALGDITRGHFEVYLFATEGPDITTITLGQLVNWFIPLSLNQHLTACKAFARVELGVSKTYASIVFKPSQLKVVDDLVANGEYEDSSFNDSTMEWYHHHDITNPKVMNDGCSLISAAAAKKVWDILKQDGIVPIETPMPSAFQGRLGPCKGVWMINTAPFTATNEVWINVTKSQTKFERHAEDYNEILFDPERLTFEVNDWARKPTTSTLSIEYMPILKDRKVPHQSILNFIRGLLKSEIDSFTRALDDPAALYCWLVKQFPISISKKGLQEGQMPSLFSQKAKLLLESGFLPKKFTHLAELIHMAAKEYFNRMCSSLKVLIPRSTNLIGVADHVGVLRPNEIHVAFSEPFTDERDGFKHAFLDGIDVIVSRHPALRPSDMQKVKAVLKPELSHLMDVVVFPTTGSFPLAAKLQGGDYDGDKFFLCWEPELVQPFQNAPAPTSLPPPESYGIEVDQTRVGDHTTTESFLHSGFTFQLQEQLLGICTNFYEALVYQRNSITDPTVRGIADIHDYLVDTAKNGYKFGKEAWRKYLIALQVPSILRSPPTPPYKVVMENATLLESKIPPFREDNILDDVIFNVTRVEAMKALEGMRNTQENARPLDSSVAALFEALLKSPDKKRRRIAEKLEIELQQIIDLWLKANRARLGDKNVAYNKAFKEGRARLQGLEPATKVNVSRTWFERHARHLPSYWELVKASALHAKFPTRSDFVFEIAGPLICYLKAHDVQESPRHCISEIFMGFKMRTHVQMTSEGLSEQQQRMVNSELAEEDEAEGYTVESLQAEAQTQYYDAMEELDGFLASSSLTTSNLDDAFDISSSDWQIVTTQR